MLLIFAITFLLINVVRSNVVSNETQCNDYYMKINEEPICNITSYCANNNCIIKCCGDGEILNIRGQCNKATIFKKWYSKVNYSNIPIYTWDRSAPKKTKKNLIHDFEYVRNKRLAEYECTYEYIMEKFYILEDGSLKVENKKAYNPWIDINRLDYCVDYKIVITMYENRTGRNRELKFVYRESRPNVGSDNDIKSKFVSYGMLLSCFFMLLVLAVYCVLPQLRNRNIGGMMLMAYVWSLFVTYLLKAIMSLAITSLTAEDCKIFSPILYYAALSSFFWLNILSFDIWWTLRGTRKCREIHRRGERVKFMWYCLFAWGTPLLMTSAATLVDNLDLTEWPSVIKPPFEDCIANDDAVFMYLQIPIAIIIIVNIILFLMTGYNIWLIKHAVRRNPDFRKSKNDENRFCIYIKLAIMMGVSWALDLAPDMSVWLFIVINFCNVFMGVGIFFLFVFKKSILIMLCKRFGIKNKFVENLQASRSITTQTTKTSTFKSSRSQGRDQETTQ